MRILGFLLMVAQSAATTTTDIQRGIDLALGLTQHSFTPFYNLNELCKSQPTNCPGSAYEAGVAYLSGVDQNSIPDLIQQFEEIPPLERRRIVFVTLLSTRRNPDDLDVQITRSIHSISIILLVSVSLFITYKLLTCAHLYYVRSRVRYRVRYRGTSGDPETEAKPIMWQTKYTHLDDDCVVCLCPLSDCERSVTLGVCGHALHTLCFLETQQDACPLCRLKFLN